MKTNQGNKKGNSSTEESRFNSRCSRKEAQWSDVHTDDAKHYERMLKELPVYIHEELYADDMSTPNTGSAVMEEGQRWLILKAMGETFIINTEGYCYARYALRLINVKSGQSRVTNKVNQGSYTRMEGLTNQGDLRELAQRVESIAEDLMDDGFDADEITDYLKQKVGETMEGK